MQILSTYKELESYLLDKTVTISEAAQLAEVTRGWIRNMTKQRPTPLTVIWTPMGRLITRESIQKYVKTRKRKILARSAR